MNLEKAIIDWIETHKPRAPESFYQMESVIEALPELGEIVCEFLGYYEDKD